MNSYLSCSKKVFLIIQDGDIPTILSYFKVEEIYLPFLVNRMLIEKQPSASVNPVTQLGSRLEEELYLEDRKLSILFLFAKNLDFS